MMPRVTERTPPATVSSPLQTSALILSSKSASCAASSHMHIAYALTNSSLLLIVDASGVAPEDLVDAQAAVRAE